MTMMNRRRAAFLALMLASSAPCAAPALAATLAATQAAAAVAHAPHQSRRPDWTLLAAAGIAFLVGRMVIHRRAKSGGSPPN